MVPSRAAHGFLVHDEPTLGPRRRRRDLEELDAKLVAQHGLRLAQQSVRLRQAPRPENATERQGPIEADTPP